MNELSHYFATACCSVLKERRLRLGLSQEVLAARASLARSYICDVERGARSPALYNLSLIAAGLDTSTSELLMDVELKLASQLDLVSLRAADKGSVQSELFSYFHTRIKDGVIICDISGQFVFVNDAAEKITGIGMHSLQPQEWAERYGCFLPDRKTLFPTEQLPLVRALSGESVDKTEIHLANESFPGGFRPVLVTSRPLKDESGKLKGAAIMFNDAVPMSASAGSK